MTTVNTLCDLVRPTFGPASNKVIIGKSQLYVSALDDGVQIAKDLQLDDETQNTVLKLIREVAVKTNDRVGDGTTSSLIILQALMQEVEKNGKIDGRKIGDELKKGLEEAVSQLRKQSKKIKGKQELEEVARISFDNEEVAKLLAEMVHTIGPDGIIDVEMSAGFGIESELTKGFTVQGGYISPYMVTEREEAVFDNPYILVSDGTFVNGSEIVPIMEKIVQSGGNSLVIFSKGFEGEALATALINKAQGKFKTLAVKTFEHYEDIALLTGATAQMSEKGSKPLELSDLGRAKKVIAKRDSTVIIGGKGVKAKIEKFAQELRQKAEEATHPLRKNQTLYRLGRLTNNVGVIRVGAPTENEAKALQYKVEDASHAVRVAYRDGVVAGAGEALLKIKTSSPILNEALKAPRKQLEENMGPITMSKSIIDPVSVLIAGLESAVSIATLLVSTKGIIVEERPKND